MDKGILMAGVEVHHGRYLRSHNYRTNLLRILVDHPFDVVTLHDSDGACCKREAWAVTQATITKTVDEDPAAWHNIRPRPQGSRWLWSEG